MKRYRALRYLTGSSSKRATVVITCLDRPQPERDQHSPSRGEMVQSPCSHGVLELPVDVSLLHGDLADVLRIDDGRVVAEDDEVGALADFD